MNVWKKLGALTVVIVLAMSFCVMAGAAETMDSDGILGESNTTSNLDSVLNIPVNLKVFNPSKTKVYAPNISYSFSVTAGESGSITDTNNIQANTKMPTTDQIPTVTSATLSWTSAGEVDAGSSGADNIQNLVLTFNKEKFTASGVYRFVITEEATYSGTGVTGNTVGVDSTDSNKHVLYLDVYFKDSGTTAADTIYAYVLHTGDTTNATNKVTGFVDEYHTSNVKVTKTLQNDAAMNDHQFPMNVAFNKGEITKFHILTSKTGVNAVVSTLADDAYTDSSAKVANGATSNFIEYIGIPTGVTFTVTETNDVEGTTYNAQYKIDNGEMSTATPIFTSSSLATTSVTVSADTDHVISFTNTLVNISPTGVTLRYAPYLLTLGAGVVALPLSRSFKRREDF